MKVQWQLVDMDSKKVLATIDDPFSIELEKLRKYWQEQYEGTGLSSKPVGVLGNLLPIPKSCLPEEFIDPYTGIFVWGWWKSYQVLQAMKEETAVVMDEGDDSVLTIVTVMGWGNLYTLFI